MKLQKHVVEIQSLFDPAYRHLHICTYLPYIHRPRHMYTSTTPSPTHQPTHLHEYLTSMTLWRNQKVILNLHGLIRRCRRQPRPLALLHEHVYRQL